MLVEPQGPAVPAMIVAGWDPTDKLYHVLNLGCLAEIDNLVKKENDYDYQEIDLGTARTKEPLGISGTSLTVKGLAGEATVRFNSEDKPAIPLAAGEMYELRFTEVYLSNAEQPGKGLKLFIGKVI